MKLNEKSLSKFASSGAPPDKEGYLHKRGDFNRGYLKRWFVLKGNLFFYYERRGEKDPIGKHQIQEKVKLKKHAVTIGPLKQNISA